jgi:hypothetical protein
VTDWQAWHTPYDDAGSPLHARLVEVQQRIRTWADAAPAGRLRLISMCAGQGRDVIGALSGHPRRDDVDGLLVELDAVNVDAARVGLSRLPGVRAVVGDAGTTAAYGEPADLLLVCGVLGNISDGDVLRTVDALPMLCRPGAVVVWTCHRRAPDLTQVIRPRLSAAGFDEVAFTSPGPDSWAVGTARYAGPPVPLRRVRLFTFA